MTGRPVAALSLAVALACVLAACSSAPQTRPRARHDARPDKQSTQPHTSKPQVTKLPAIDHASGVRTLAKGPVSPGWRVTRIVDGDTVDATRRGRTLTLRLIGIDTPETVHPTVPIECYGPEASAYARRALLSEPVTLEFDRSQGRTDYYDRTLAYLWLTDPPEPRLFNEEAIRRGYANEYTYDSAYAWQQEFIRAEQVAQSQRRGLWLACR